jgi:tetrahydromethanopterin S-methyltransferase subunit G
MATTDPIATVSQDASKIVSTVKSDVAAEVAKVEAVEAGLSKTQIFLIGSAVGALVGLIVGLVL